MQARIEAMMYGQAATESEARNTASLIPLPTPRDPAYEKFCAALRKKNPNITQEELDRLWSEHLKTHTQLDAPIGQGSLQERIREYQFGYSRTTEELRELENRIDGVNLNPIRSTFRTDVGQASSILPVQERIRQAQFGYARTPEELQELERRIDGQ